MNVLVGNDASQNPKISTCKCYLTDKDMRYDKVFHSRVAFHFGAPKGNNL